MKLENTPNIFVTINDKYSFNISNYDKDTGHSNIRIKNNTKETKLNTFFSFGGCIKITRDSSYNKLPKHVINYISDFLNSHRFTKYISTKPIVWTIKVGN